MVWCPRQVKPPTHAQEVYQWALVRVGPSTVFRGASWKGRSQPRLPLKKVRLVHALRNKKLSCFLLIIKSCSKVSDLKVPNLLKSKRGKEIDLISIKLIKQHCLSFQNLVACYIWFISVLPCTLAIQNMRVNYDYCRSNNF